MENTQAPTLIAECNGVITWEYVEEMTMLAGGAKGPRREIKPREMYVLGSCLIVLAVLIAVLLGGKLNFLTSIVLIFGVIILLLPTVNRALDKVVWKQYQLVQNAPFTIRFNDQDVQYFTPRGETHFRYAEVTQICDSQRGLLLKLPDNSTIMADKTQFTPEQLSAVLQILYNNGVKYKYIDR